MMEIPSWKKAVAEFVGTFALIYVGVMVLVARDAPSLLEVAFAHGLTIAVMASATMSISGGQLNPAVTLGLLVANRISLAQAAYNWVAQVAGGIVGAIAAAASLGGASIVAGIPALGDGVTLTQGLLVEFVLAFFLVFVVFGTAVDPRFGARIGALAIGLTVTLDILAGGPITGASMNTARYLGPALVAMDFRGAASAITHLVGPLLGGVVAGALWRFVLLDAPRPHPEPQAQMRAKGNP